MKPILYVSLVMGLPCLVVASADDAHSVERLVEERATVSA